MKQCQQIGYQIHYCPLLYDYVQKTGIKTEDFEFCPFCREHLHIWNNGDPWLYMGAIVSRWLPSRLDRELIRFAGQNMEGYLYCVHGTPWEYVNSETKTILISDNGYIATDINRQFKFCWYFCPKSLLPKNADAKKYDRPEWTKYLPGGKK